MSNVITVKNMIKKFDSFMALDNVSFEVNKGEIFGFLGANGAGKTTAIRILCGLLFPTSGQVTVAGYDIYQAAEKIKENIGYMSQKFSLYEDLTVRENIRFYGGIYGLTDRQIQAKTQQMITRLQLTTEANTRVKHLPLGWKQKLAFLIALIHDPKIVFLDEPTGGVDPITRREFWSLIYETVHNDKGSIFVTTHYMDEAEYCDRVTILVDGRIEVIGSPQALKQQYQVEHMDQVFVQIVRNPPRH